MLTLDYASEVVTEAPKPGQSNMTEVQVVVGPTLKSGTPIISGFMPANLIIPHAYEIPYFNPLTKKGYQRKPQDARVNQLAGDLRKGRVDLPTAILLNIRNREAREAVQHGVLFLDFLNSSTALSSKFFVVDGQHRILALAKLIDENAEQWGSFVVPFVCMLGANEDEEMRQFHIVNSTAKSVRTDLALELLRKRADKDPGVIEGLEERGRGWQLRGQQLVERLAQESLIWKNQIRLANMEKGDTTIPAASMVESLKVPLQSPFFGGATQDDQLKILEAFWQGLREVLRPVFDTPTEYALQKGVGVIVMHGLLPYIIEIVRTQGGSVTEAEAFARVLKQPLLELEGEDGSGTPVAGAQFWAASPHGAAGSYSSSAGRRVLGAKVRVLLPGVVVE